MSRRTRPGDPGEPRHAAEEYSAQQEGGPPDRVRGAVDQQSGHPAQEEHPTGDPGRGVRHPPPDHLVRGPEQCQRDEYRQCAQDDDDHIVDVPPRAGHHELVAGGPSGKSRGDAERPPDMWCGKEDGPDAGRITDPALVPCRRAHCHLLYASAVITAMTANPRTATAPLNMGAFSKASGIIVSIASARRMPPAKASNVPAVAGEAAVKTREPSTAAMGVTRLATVHTPAM